MPRFVGRLPVVGIVEPLDQKSLVDILTEPKNAIVKQYKKMFAIEGVELIFTNEALYAMAQIAIERSSGARGLRSVMESLMLQKQRLLPCFHLLLRQDQS